jgi:hypothetical protein
MNPSLKAVKAVNKTSHNTQSKIKASKLVAPTKEIEKRDPDSEKSPWLDQYRDFYTGNTHPVDMRVINQISCQLIDYVRNTEGYLRHEAFFLDKGIPFRTAQKWAKKYEHFGEVYETAKLILGIRREDGAMRKKFDAGTIHITMPLYDDSWKEIMKWREEMRAKANAEQEQRPTQIILGQLSGLDIKDTV